MIRKWLGDETFILEAVAIVTVFISLLIKGVLLVGHCCLMRVLSQVQQGESPALVLRHQTKSSLVLTSPDLPTPSPLTPSGLDCGNPANQPLTNLTRSFWQWNTRQRNTRQLMELMAVMYQEPCERRKLGRRLSRSDSERLGALCEAK